MRLEPVTQDHLTEQQLLFFNIAVKAGEMLAKAAETNCGADIEEANEYDGYAKEQFAALINAEREVGVRSVVELVRKVEAARAAYDSYVSEATGGKGLPVGIVRKAYTDILTAKANLAELLALYPEQR